MNKKEIWRKNLEEIKKEIELCCASSLVALFYEKGNSILQETFLYEDWGDNLKKISEDIQTEISNLNLPQKEEFKKRIENLRENAIDLKRLGIEIRKTLNQIPEDEMEILKNLEEIIIPLFKLIEELIKLKKDLSQNISSVAELIERMF